jgi:hypothetical protein
MQRDRPERGWQGVCLAAARQFERPDLETSRRALPEGERLTKLAESCGAERSRHQLPTASLTHFLTWLVFAAPASFLSEADLLQAVDASFSHFVMKDLSAAPASFF